MVSKFLALRTLGGTIKKVNGHIAVIWGASARYCVITGTSHLSMSLETSAVKLTEMSVSPY